MFQKAWLKTEQIFLFLVFEASPPLHLFFCRILCSRSLVSMLKLRDLDGRRQHYSWDSLEDMTNTLGSTFQIPIETAQILYFSIKKTLSFYPGWACSLGGISLLQPPLPGKVINYPPSLDPNSVFMLHISAPEHRGQFWQQSNGSQPWMHIGSTWGALKNLLSVSWRHYICWFQNIFQSCSS